MSVKKSLACLLSASGFGFASVASAAVYLKPLSAGETRAQDGASWATAFADVASAVAKAQETSDGTLYAASGVYVVPAKISLSKSLAIFGGFAGVSADETPERRAPDAKPTIFSGDKNGDDVWAHVTFDADRCQASDQTLAGQSIIAEGRIQPASAYEGDYDIYCLAKGNTSDNTPACFEIAEKAAALAVDGVTFAGFVSGNLNGNVINCRSGHSAALALTNCQFLANASSEGSVWTENGTRLTLARTRFAHARADRNAGVNVKGATDVSDCTFESIYTTGSLRANAIFVHAGSAAVSLARTSFVRLGKFAYVNDNFGGPSVAIGGEQGSGVKAFRNCVVSNCYGVVSSNLPNGSIPIVSPNAGAWTFEGCRFARNLGASRTVSGRAYTLFGVQAGRSAGKVQFSGCVFDANVCVSTATSAGGGASYALGICGSSAKDADQLFVNCVFDRNRVEPCAQDGVTVVRSQGVLAAAVVGAVLTAVANCTFRSLDAPGVVDVAYYGDQHEAPVNVVNSLFMSDADVATPFHSATPASSGTGLHTYGVTAQNVLSAPADILDGGGWQFDAVPFETTPAGILTPAVRTPGLRETADLVVVGALTGSALPEYRFRPAGAAADGWMPLNADALSSAEDGTAVTDIVGNARPEGASTRGARQSLTSLAESGRSLVLRRSPLMGGTLSGPSAQAVADGDRPCAVTAVPAADAFLGWYDASGTCLSSEATLSLERLDADLVLTARFATQKVSLTFDLGDGGTFADSGTSKVVLSLSAGEPFPDVPAYTPSPDWIVTGFGGAFPKWVPDADTVYRAELLTTAVRVFRVVPTDAVPDGSDRSGSSWANATDDLAAALADAARYRGELWLKAGVYSLEKTLDIRSNVGVYGGFDGTEARRDEADPAARATVLTGDGGRDDYWTADGVAVEGNLKVFDYETCAFLPSASDGRVWRAVSSGNTTTAFATDAVGQATNVVFSGLTFVSFSEQTLRFDASALRSTALIENCAFYACGFGSPQAAALVTYGSACVRNCRFVSCRSGVAIGWGNQVAVGGDSLLADCLFEGCEASQVPVVWFSNRENGAMLTNCTIRRCWATGGVRILSLQIAGSPVRVTGLAFDRNARVGGGASANEVGSLIDICSQTRFAQCRFTGNTNATDVASGSVAGLFSLKEYQARPLVRDSYFADNAARVTDVASTATAAAIAVARQGSFTFLNCTFERNAAEVASGGVAAMAAAEGMRETSLALVHCTVVGSRLQGGRQAELYQAAVADQPETSTLGVFNSVLFNADAQYRPLAPGARSPVMVSQSHLSNVREGELALDLANVVWRGVRTDDPRLQPAPTTRADGLSAWGLRHESPLVRRGEKIYLSDDVAYFRDETADAAKPWRRVVNPAYRVASVGTLTTESPLVADAFGQPRPPRRVSAGPLVVPPGGILFVVR